MIEWKNTAKNTLFKFGADSNPLPNLKMNPITIPKNPISDANVRPALVQINKLPLGALSAFQADSGRRVEFSVGAG